MFDRYTETVLTNVGINIIMTLSVYLPLAVGQLSIAQVGFMAIGAHLATVLTLYLDVPFGLALLAAAILSWGVGLLVGRLLIHLQGLTLAFATFAFMEIVQVFFLNFTPTGDARGIKGIQPLTELWHVWALVAALILFFYRLRHSRLGRAMAMVKHDEIVAQSLGVNVTSVKVLAFAAGALVAGVGGGLYAHFAMFGGIEVWFGGVLGAAVLSYMPVLLQVFDHWRLEVHGAIILIVMGLRPQGVLAFDLVEALQSLRQRWRSPRPLSLRDRAGVRERSHRPETPSPSPPTL
jgi:branched-chain amino acid transport system permease protein